MKNKLLTLSQFIHPSRLSGLAAYMLRDEAISGKLILAGLALALISANTPLSAWYESLLHGKLSLGYGTWSVSLEIKEWISEGLMTLFFLVVGLELKRELVHGELRHREMAILPFAAAIGGMVLPALIFVLLNFGKDTISGWAIPTATDIALAVGILALLGERIPSSVRIFLLALAIVDDLIAVIVIAVFYSVGLNGELLLLMALLVGFIYYLGKLKTLPMPVFVAGGVMLWFLALESGIHPSIVGAILGLVAPVASRWRQGEQVAERAERAMIPFTTLIVVPLFTFANTGIVLNAASVGAANDVMPLGLGIIAGLVVGKFFGILGASWVMVRLGLSRLPARASWLHITGVSLLAGIGFTVAIFVTDLAFTNPEYIVIAKLSVIVASAIAALGGLLVLVCAGRARPIPLRVRGTK